MSGGDSLPPSPAAAESWTDGKWREALLARLASAEAERDRELEAYRGAREMFSARLASAEAVVDLTLGYIDTPFEERQHAIFANDVRAALSTHRSAIQTEESLVGESGDKSPEDEPIQLNPEGLRRYEEWRRSQEPPKV